MNNQSLLTYQKQYLSSSALQNAKQIGIDISLFELALYIRYAHRVDYPEIAELIGIFLDAYIS